MEYIAGDPRTKADWLTDNPRRAAHDFVAADKRLVLERPAPGFNEASVDVRTTYWPDAYLKRVS